MLNRFLGSNATDTEQVVDPTWIEHDGLHSKFNRDNNLKLKIMKKRFGIKAFGASLILYLAFSTGCYYDQVYVAPPEHQISYAEEIQPLWDTKGCMTCHDTGRTEPILTPAVSYNNIVPSKVDLANPPNSIIYTVLGGFMKGDITSEDEAVVLKWIEQGALNN